MLVIHVRCTPVMHARSAHYQSMGGWPVDHCNWQRRGELFQTRGFGWGLGAIALPTDNGGLRHWSRKFVKFDPFSPTFFSD